MPELKDLKLHEQLMLLRRRKNITISRASRDTYIPEAYLSMYENGKYSLTADMLGKYQSYLLCQN